MYVSLSSTDLRRRTLFVCFLKSVRYPHFIHLRRHSSLNTATAAAAAAAVWKWRTLIELKWIQLDLCITLGDSVLLGPVNMHLSDGWIGSAGPNIYAERDVKQEAT
jgi:hypothetical protein